MSPHEPRPTTHGSGDEPRILSIDEAPYRIRREHRRRELRNNLLAMLVLALFGAVCYGIYRLFE